jgi:multidrug efflux pump subunit AcrA (membrane-fusion protein)
LARLIQLEGSVPKKDLEQARIELDSLQARRAASAGALDGRVALRAPVAGVVAASQVVIGQVVEAKDILFEIVDPRRLAVEALVFDALPSSGLGRASARLGNVEGDVLALDFIGAGRSLREQALPVLFRVRPAPGGEVPPLAVGQSLKVLAETGARQSGVALAIGALGRNGSNEAVVWVHETAERFVPRRVKTVSLDANRILVLEGLTGGERIVASGAQALNQIR